MIWDVLDRLGLWYDNMMIWPDVRWCEMIWSHVTCHTSPCICVSTITSACHWTRSDHYIWISHVHWKWRVTLLHHLASCSTARVHPEGRPWWWQPHTCCWVSRFGPSTAQMSWENHDQQRVAKACKHRDSKTPYQPQHLVVVPYLDIIISVTALNQKQHILVRFILQWVFGWY